MGQRHQFFAIARVRRPQQTQPKYECVVAIHHQWCYGISPLRAVDRFRALLQNPTNASIIRAELRLLEDMESLEDGGWNTELKDMTQCPYTAFLFSDAIYTNVGSEEGPVFGSLPWTHHLLPCTMGSQDGDNNDGITIVDITDPRSPSYCFIGWSDEFEETGVPLGHPLSGTQYARVYYPKEENEDQSTTRDVKLLDEVEMIKGWQLAEAWPSEYHELRRVKKPKVVVGEAEAQVTIPSLTESTLKQTTIEAVKLRDMTALESLASLGRHHGDKILLILKRLHPVPDSATSLIATLFTQTLQGPAIDLSDWHLSDEQLCFIFSSVQSSTEITHLDLSRNPNLTIDTRLLELFPKRFPNLTHLFLLGCPSIPDNTALSLTHPSVLPRIICIAHPAFFHIPNTAPFPALQPHEHRFTIIADFNDGNQFKRPGVSFTSLNPVTTIQRLAHWASLFTPDFTSNRFTGVRRCGTGTFAAFFATSLFPDHPSTLLSPNKVDGGSSSDSRLPQSSGRAKWNEREVVRVPRTNEGYGGPMSSASRPGEWGLVISWTSGNHSGNSYSFLRRLPGSDNADMESTSTTQLVDARAQNLSEMDYLQFIEAFARESPIPIEKGLVDAFKSTFGTMFAGMTLKTEWGILKDDYE